MIIAMALVKNPLRTLEVRIAFFVTACGLLGMCVLLQAPPPICSRILSGSWLAIVTIDVKSI